MAGQRVTARTRFGRTALLDRVLTVAVRLPIRVIAVANGVVIALLGVLGVLSIAYGSPFAIFDLDGERNVPAIYSAALLFSVAVLALLVGRLDPAPGLPYLWVDFRLSSSSSRPTSSARFTSVWSESWGSTGRSSTRRSPSSLSCSGSSLHGD